MKTLAVIGGGGWGTALACVLAPRFTDLRLWVYEQDLAERIRETRINDVFLPGVRIPANVVAGNSLERAIENADIVVSALPSHVVRDIFDRARHFLAKDAKIVSATKGLEAGTLLRISEVIASAIGRERPLAVLSGPTFAAEVARGSPTALVAASADAAFAAEIQTAFSGPAFRVYAGADTIGVEIGGALKNVIAIGAGISDGLGLGHNARAALITRGLAELTRLAVAIGAQRETLFGLAGLGDLVLTCTGDLSRNRQVGLKLAAGMKLGQILDSTPMVAEGVKTTSVALELAARYGVEMPIAGEMDAVLNRGRPAAEAIRNLMTRSLRTETA
jgi:glycerol-3-phosphate dehydrogenase (NAD(P)+)